MSHRVLVEKLAIVALALTLGGIGAGAGTQEPARSVQADDLLAQAHFAATPAQIAQALEHRAQEPWKPAVRKERERGTEDVYARVAPATVVVRCGNGHGTGFVIDAEGWIVTNHHVIDDAPVDPATGIATATVHLGRLGDDGIMQLLEEGIPAQLYKDSPDKDLALLKLTRLPDGWKSLPVVPLAGQGPRPGSECLAIGHPAAGLLWTLRRGEVSGVGNWPREMIDVIMERLALPVSEQKQLETMTASVPPRKVLISTCQLNPGDSGGPLVNAAGELIAVSFAIPRSRGDVNLDKFSYHVHLDEVKAFLEQRPEKPLLSVPDPWPAGILAAMADLDEDGTPDTVVFGTEKGKRPTGFLFDLAQQSGRVTPAQLADAQERGAWKFAFALHLQPVVRAFYDTSNAGQIDLILTDTDGDGKADYVLKRDQDQWIREPGEERKMLDPSLIPDKKMSQRLRVIMKRLGW